MGATAYAEITEARLLPHLVRLDVNLYGAVFSLMKLVPARYILRKAARDGRLGPDTLIAETTSGTFGLALAMQAALMGRRLVLVSDPVIDTNLHRRLTDLGAEVVICARPAPVGGYQEARLARLERILAEHPDSFCPEQYSNPDNPTAYVDVAAHLREALGPVDCVVGPVGSGGSMCGTVRALRTERPAVRAIGVDTYSSVLFGQPDGIRAVRGLGNSVMPANLDHAVFDEVHWCTSAEVFAATRALHRGHAVFQGPTSGAAYQVARWWAARNRDALCVVLLPDEGYRYADTAYDDAWLAGNGLTLADPPTEPVRVAHPSQVAERWGWYPWNRRPYADVVGHPGHRGRLPVADRAPADLEPAP